jgi:protocatechuate 3,4-dioxygenase beta subunit
MFFANAQSANPKPKPTGSISGRVTIDGNPAAGIPVAAVLGESVNRRDATAKAITDVQGYYLISGLGPGQYQIWTLTPTMIAEPGTAPVYFNYSGAIKSIILGANEDVQSIDLRLIRGAVITGRVTNADNKPVIGENVSVQLLDPTGAPRFGAIGPTYDERNQTDDRGIYRIFGLPPGRYKVSVGYDPAEGIRRGQRYQKTFYPDTNDLAKATIVELREADEASTIDIKVEPAPPTFVASGRVIDSESGVPIPKAGISFMTAPKAGPAATTFGIQADDRGQFSFSGISPGRYAAYATSQYYGGNFYGDPVYFEVADKDVTGIELKTLPGLSLTGIVVADGLSTKDLLTMLPGLRLQARATGSNDQFGSGGSSPIAPDGSFQIDGLRPGRVSINLFGSNIGFPQADITRIERDGAGLNQGFEIQQSVSGLRVVVNYGTGVIRGAIRFEGDTPIAGAQIYVRYQREGVREGGGVQVDARGHFLIKNLAPGQYGVTVQVRAGGPSQANRPTPPQKQTVTVTNGAESAIHFVFDFRPPQGGP